MAGQVDEHHGLELGGLVRLEEFAGPPERHVRPPGPGRPRRVHNAVRHVAVQDRVVVVRLDKDVVQPKGPEIVRAVLRVREEQDAPGLRMLNDESQRLGGVALIVPSLAQI